METKVKRIRLTNDTEFRCPEKSDKRITVTPNLDNDKTDCVLSIPETKENFKELLRLQRDFAFFDGCYLVSVNYKFIEQIVF